jgi:hypothetical protein
VPGGANWQRLAQSPLADMWPLTPSVFECHSKAQVHNRAALFAERRSTAPTGWVVPRAGDSWRAAD